MHTFKTLLLREWMQHHRGWLILAIAPFVLAMLALPFGSIQIDEEPSASGLLITFAGVYVLMVMAIALSATLLQAPGMARRDWQDRSIEFWNALPVKHWHSVLATQVSHLLLMPALVLGIALLCALPVASVIVWRVFGAEALLSMPWGSVGTVMAVGSLRLVYGLLLGMLWLLPLVMALMAAAAWLKGWGPVVLIAAVLVGGGVLMASTGNAIVFDTLKALAEQTRWALLPSQLDGANPIDVMSDSANALARLPGYLGTDAWLITRQLATPLFAFGLAVAGLGFWLQVLRRQRGA